MNPLRTCSVFSSKPAAGLMVFAGVMGVMLSTASVSLAQLAPSAPAPAQKSPDYTPPAPPPPPPPPAPEIKIPAPDLVRRGEDGKIVRLTVPTEEAAMAMMSFDPTTEDKRKQITVERRARQDAAIAENPLAAIEVRRVLLTAEEINDLNTFVKTRSMMDKVLLTRTSLSMMMQQGGGISAGEQKAIAESAKAYVDAIYKETTDSIKGRNDPTLSGLTLARTNLPRAGIEFNRAFDRMLDEAVAKWPELRKDIAGSLASLADREAGVAKAEGAKAKREAMLNVLQGLPESDIKTVLSRVATPMPANPIVPPELTQAPAAPNMPQPARQPAR
ncbi:MAG: hypothetical protein IBJ18_11270 [Phycisphaerales bacterium]|nr:hypothetical protein [Phycisphaerales bacterium]